MQHDVFYTIGAGHEHCQDYAYAIMDECGYVHMAVCDGCSSALLSHIGAVLMAHAAVAGSSRYHIVGETSEGECMWHILGSACSAALGLGIPFEALTATLLYLEEYEYEIKIWIVGDGHVGVEYTHNRMSHYHRWYENNAPRYLRYYADETLLRRYTEEFGGIAHTTMIKYDECDNMLTLNDVDNSVDNCMVKYIQIPKIDLVSIVLSTDGIDSFVPEMDSDGILRDIIGFKSTTGAFLQRRMKRVLSGLSKSGCIHEDDIGVGAVIV